MKINSNLLTGIAIGYLAAKYLVGKSSVFPSTTGGVTNPLPNNSGVFPTVDASTTKGIGSRWRLNCNGCNSCNRMIPTQHYMPGKTSSQKLAIMTA